MKMIKSAVHPFFGCNTGVYLSLGIPWCNLNVDPKRLGSCGSYELLVSTGAYQINDKLLYNSLGKGKKKPANYPHFQN